MKFLLGTHRPHWLAQLDVPLFVSDRTLRRYKTLPVATCDWACDSGGFSQLSQCGTWACGPTPREYAARIRRYRDEIGRLLWAAPQDHMCEDAILARTGLDVARHQDLTVSNYLELRSIDANLPFIPVLQGQSIADYHRCADLYECRGVDLTTAPLVGWAASADVSTPRKSSRSCVRWRNVAIDCMPLARKRWAWPAMAPSSPAVTLWHGLSLRVGSRRCVNAAGTADATTA
ncbi:hypothetical protein OHS18_13615 [Amycolatopsis sp. NBC_00355]